MMPDEGVLLWLRGVPVVRQAPTVPESFRAHGFPRFQLLLIVPGSATSSTHQHQVTSPDTLWTVYSSALLHEQLSLTTSGDFQQWDEQ
jgi:hypothetical protein